MGLGYVGGGVTRPPFIPPHPAHHHHQHTEPAHKSPPPSAQLATNCRSSLQLARVRYGGCWFAIEHRSCPLLNIPPGLCLVSSFPVTMVNSEFKIWISCSQPGYQRFSPICVSKVFKLPDPSQSGFFPNRLLTQSGLTLPPLLHCTWPTSTLLLYTSTQKVPYCRAGLSME